MLSRYTVTASFWEVAERSEATIIDPTEDTQPQRNTSLKVKGNNNQRAQQGSAITMVNMSSGQEEGSDHWGTYL